LINLFSKWIFLYYRKIRVCRTFLINFTPKRQKEVEDVNRIFQLFLDWSNHDVDPVLLGAFFRTLTEHFGMTQADPKRTG
jgi:hypothetical protein